MTDVEVTQVEKKRFAFNTTTAFWALVMVLSMITGFTIHDEFDNKEMNNGIPSLFNSILIAASLFIMVSILHLVNKEDNEEEEDDNTADASVYIAINILQDKGENKE